MDFKSFVEKAKEVAATATEQATGAVNAALSPEQTNAAWDQAKSFATQSAEKLAELKDFGSEKLQALIASFQQALPAIQMAGYELTEFEVELGVTPKLIPHFKHAPKPPEDVARARELVRENKLGALILSGLLKAGEVHQQINVAGFHFAHIEVELGVIPSVRLQYKNDEPGGAPAARGLPPADTTAALPAPSSASGQA